jgi:CheY-like chemotaxis protein/anti-sigma regulatory factor (Ser/Thr protein kinase)
MGSLLAETELTGEQKELLDTVVRSSDQLLAIINNLLDYSQMESGALQLEKRPFSLRDCLNSSAAIITPEALDKGLKIHTRIPDDLHDTYIGDAVRLRQILINLLQNAVKFTEEGSVTIEANYLSDSQKLQINVTDTGIGIPPEKQTQIFSSFGQIDNSMTREYGGLGLGLAISSHLCRLMGGEITVKSEVGKGSLFSISIPVQKTQTETPHRFANAQPSLRGKRVLIIAPNTQDRRQVTLETRKAGMQSYVAGTIQEGLFWLKRPNSFDAAILDCTLIASEEPFILTQIQDALQKQHIPLVLLENENTPYTGTQFSSSSRLTAPVTAAQVYNVLIGVLTLTKQEEERQSKETAVSPAAPKAKTNGSTSKASKANMAAKHPLKILLVEDNIINQKVAAKLLQNLGYEPDIASNGKEGLEKLSTSSYDVVLMDIQMPVMDGLEATAQIHQQFPPEKRPTIVALTAHAVEGDREYYLSQGMDAYLSKPIQVNALIETLYNCKPVQEMPPANPQTKAELPAEQKPFVSEAPLVNLDMLQKLMGDSAETFLADMLPGFYMDAEVLITKIQESVEKNEGQTAKLAAGQLQSTAATLGMQALAQACQQIETAVNNNDFSTLKNTAVSLQQIFQAIKNETARFLQPN